jgi:dUTP pyrophosphatase
MEILIKRISENTTLPAYGREAGPSIDLYAATEVRIEPGARAQVSTGVAMAFPVGFVGQIVDQYNTVIEEAVRVTPCTIDSGHRSEIRVELHNIGTTPVTFLSGSRVAQLLVVKVERAQLIEAEDVSASA